MKGAAMRSAAPFTAIDLLKLLKEYPNENAQNARQHFFDSLFCGYASLDVNNPDPMKMEAKLATGTAMNEDVTVLLQGGALKNQVRHVLPEASDSFKLIRVNIHA
jgi:hypothetical protein